MSVLTCPEVEELIDLHAAGACDAATDAAVRRHLAACPDCARARREVERLQGLLDIHYRAPEALERLRTRLDADDSGRRERARVLPLLRRAASLAALVLLSVGLALLMRPSGAGLPSAEAVAVVWASPGARWSESAGAHAPRGAAGPEIALDAGELWLRVQPGKCSVKLRTPAGVMSAEAAECFVAVRPAERKGPSAEVRIAVRDGTVRLTNGQGEARARSGEVLQAEAGGVPRRQIEALALRFGRHYQPVSLKGRPRIPTQPPPGALAWVTNYAALAQAFHLDPSAAEQLRASGFVVLPGGGEHELAATYRRLQALELPILITADTLLHVTRGHLDQTLHSLEERVLLPDLSALTEALLHTIDRTPPPANSETWQAARKQALGYLGVALRALRPEAELPRDVDAAAVAEALTALRKGSGPVHVRLLGRAIDFSLHRPQGHYAGSARLRGYHAAMTWFSQAPLLLEGGPGHLVAMDEARRQTLAAVLLAEALARTALPDGRKATVAWERIYTVTAFFTGLTDDLGPQQYRAALARAELSGPNLGRLTDPSRLRALQLELVKQTPARDTREEPVQATTPAGLLDRLGPTAGFRLFGRRLVPDTYVFDRLTYPHIGPPTRTGQFTYGRALDGRGVRALPRGLDLLAALGSERARELLHELGDDAYAAGDGAPGYPEALAALRRQLGGFDDVDWNRNLHWSWLFAMKPLLAARGTGYPPFMTSPAYGTRSLNTALASWAHRRQDTALYTQPGALETKVAKMPQIAPPRGKSSASYVEPVPELYARLLALTRMANKGLAEMGVLDEPARQRLGALEKLLSGVLAIAEKELANEALTADGQKLLAGLLERLDSLAAAQGPRAEGYAAADTRSVATVYTDPHTGQVLQVATGLLDLGLFLYQQPNGLLEVGVGPVLSYYEFKRPLGQAVTEAPWRRLLAAPGGPERPTWTRSYPSAGKGAP
jgi:hypothetical protein